VSNSETQAWQAAYVSAVLETDPEKVSARIVEAQLEIEGRLLESPSPNALERKGIKAAWNALVALKNGRKPENYGHRSADQRADPSTGSFARADIGEAAMTRSRLVATLPLSPPCLPHWTSEQRTHVHETDQELGKNRNQRIA
jgi:hypothetical protein